MSTSHTKKDDHIEIAVWEADFGLMSIDTDCLQIILYVRMTAAPVNFKSGRICGHDYYPTLTCADTKLTNVHDIIGYLRQRSYNLDYNLTPKQCSESYAFTNMVVQNMKAVTQYIWWLDARNYEELSFPWYSSKASLPFNRIYPHHCRKTAKFLIDEALSCSDDDPDVVKRYVSSTAVQTFSMLAVRLGNKEYFYGNSPCSLDVTVYSFLASIVRVPFPSNDICELLNSWPSLIDFVKRIDDKFFPDIQRKRTGKVTHAHGEDSYLRVTAGGILFAVMVVGLFAGGFALSGNLNDIVRVQWMLLTVKY